MITKKIRKIVKYRILVMVYLFFASDWDWNAEQDCIVPASIYLRWNARLLTLETPFSFLLVTFLLSKLPNEQFVQSKEIFVTFILGWMEIFLMYTILMAGMQLKRYWPDVMYVMNEMSRYSDYVEELMRRQNTQFNREDQKYLDKRDKLIGIVAMLTTFAPVAFGGCICVMIEPTHAMLQEYFEVNISFQSKFIPFIILVVWYISNISSVAFTVVIVVLQYILLTRSVVSCLTPQSVSKTVQPGSSRNKVIIRYDLNSRYFGVLNEMTAIRIFRTQQVFNTIINEIYGSVLFASHHVACMLSFLGGALALLQATEQILDGGPLMLAGILIALFASLLVEYEESMEISALCQRSDGFVRRCANLTDRRSVLHKFAKSCPNLKVHVGYPFFNVGKNTFTQFLAQGIDFLIGMLAI
ncbi:unnamed protein product [Orchesella dallaii]|uniref:Odorant receptor n=1 Tax=Orchesella dallaii TaxID=48710 RepID=A0ABP1SAQ7_9HEXA